MSGRATIFWKHNLLWGQWHIYRFNRQRGLGVRGTSVIYVLYKTRDRTEICGTPALIYLGLYSSPSLTVLYEKFNFSNLCIKAGCQVVPKDFSVFENTAAVDWLLSKLNTRSVSLKNWFVVPWRAPNACICKIPSVVEISFRESAY